MSRRESLARFRRPLHRTHGPHSHCTPPSTGRSRVATRPPPHPTRSSINACEEPARFWVRSEYRASSRARVCGRDRGSGGYFKSHAAHAFKKSREPLFWTLPVEYHCCRCCGAYLFPQVLLVYTRLFNKQLTQQQKSSSSRAGYPARQKADRQARPSEKQRLKVKTHTTSARRCRSC